MILSNSGIEITSRDDVPVIIGMLMEKLGVTEFEFAITDLMHYVGQLDYDFDVVTGIYTIHLRKETSDVQPT